VLSPPFSDRLTWLMPLFFSLHLFLVRMISDVSSGWDWRIAPPHILHRPSLPSFAIAFPLFLYGFIQQVLARREFFSVRNTYPLPFFPWRNIFLPRVYLCLALSPFFKAFFTIHPCPFTPLKRCCHDRYFGPPLPRLVPPPHFRHSSPVPAFLSRFASFS